MSTYNIEEIIEIEYIRIKILMEIRILTLRWLEGFKEDQKKSRKAEREKHQKIY